MKLMGKSSPLLSLSVEPPKGSLSVEPACASTENQTSCIKKDTENKAPSPSMHDPEKRRSYTNLFLYKSEIISM
jgi:hypothetical protein